MLSRDDKALIWFCMCAGFMLGCIATTLYFAEAILAR